jgi:hypothetical protein
MRLLLSIRFVADLVADPFSVVIAVRDNEQSQLGHQSRKAWGAQQHHVLSPSGTKPAIGERFKTGHSEVRIS